MRRILLLVFVFGMLYSCSGGGHVSDGVVGIPLEESLPGNEVRDETVLGRISADVIPLELTDASLLGDVYLVDDTEGRLVLCDNEKVYSFDSRQGTFLSCLSHKGEGPGEYLFISDVEVCPRDSSIVILDSMGKRINTYGMYDGRLKGSLSNDTIASFQLMGNGRWVSYNSPLAAVSYDICMYDAGWREATGVYGRKVQLEYKGIIELHDFLSSNGEVYTCLNDTVYHISESGAMFPSFYIAKGALRLPHEIASDLTQKHKRNEYVWGEQMCFSDDYCFLSYYYQRKKYFDVWNLQSGQLCYRNVVSSPSDRQGLPVQMMGQTIYAWPKYVKDNIFYCIALREEAVEEENPFVLKFKMD